MSIKTERETPTATILGVCLLSHSSTPGVGILRSPKEPFRTAGARFRAGCLHTSVKASDVVRDHRS